MFTYKDDNNRIQNFRLETAISETETCMWTVP